MFFGGARKKSYCIKRRIPKKGTIEDNDEDNDDDDDCDDDDDNDDDGDDDNDDDDDDGEVGVVDVEEHEVTDMKM